MPLTLNTRTVRGVMVVEIGGRLIVGDAVAKFGDALTPIVEGENKKVILDLSNLGYLDSTGIESLIGVYQTLRNRSGGFRVLKPSSKVRELLELTKLSDVFGVVDDESDAIDALLEGGDAS